MDIKPATEDSADITYSMLKRHTALHAVSMRDYGGALSEATNAGEKFGLILGFHIGEIKKIYSFIWKVMGIGGY